MQYIEIPSQAETILKVLHGAGYEAYVVGGCVRDVLLGRTPEDWDITTSASPQQVKQLFDRTIDTGIAHGTVTVMMGKDGYEVTTYRIDGEYEDSRHPREVTFTSSLDEDLKRRDFTMNAMAYSHETGVIDLFGGIEDMKNRIIRCVGDPGERFSEDALRMLRAVRFAGQLGFQIDDSVKTAIREQAASLEKISAERIQVELVKLLMSPHPSWIRLAYLTGITAVILPEFDRIMLQRQNNPHHAYTTGEHTLVALDHIPADRILRLTMFFHDIGKPEVFTTDAAGKDHFHGHAACSEIITERIMKRLKFDNDTMHKVMRLVRHHSMFPQLSAREIRMAAYTVGPELFDSYLLVKEADTLAHHPDVIPHIMDYLKEVRHIWEDIQMHHDCLSLKEMNLNGKDLVADGMLPGPEIGEILEKLLTEVLEHPEVNSREYLLARSRELRGHEL